MENQKPAPKYQYLYVHLPFCAVICHYCDFYTERLKNADHGLLFSALAKHLDQETEQLQAPLKSIYFGGGTPSASPPDLLHTFLDKLRAYISQQTEITLEANPNDLSLENLQAWHAAGVNRLSVGVQSLRPDLLKNLSRTHSSEDALEGIARAQNIISRISADLIYAVPQQKPEDPAQDAERLVKAGVKHLSAYHLTLEQEHFLFKKLPDDSHAWEQARQLQQKLAGLGLGQYEVSNFAQPGLESVHNRAYWQGHPYLALGPSGHSFDGKNRRWQNLPDWRLYAEKLLKNESPIGFQETLTREQRFLELLFTSLRTREGLDFAHLYQETGQDLSTDPTLGEWVEQGLGVLAKGRFSLTFAGKMLADSLVEKLSHRR